MSINDEAEKPHDYYVPGIELKEEWRYIHGDPIHESIDY